MAEVNGGKGQALSDKGRRSGPKEYLPGKNNGEPQSGLGLKKGGAIGSPNGAADLKPKGINKF